MNVQNPAFSADEIDQMLEHQAERKRLNSEIAKLVDAIYDHAAAMPCRHDLKASLQMVSSLYKKLIRMKGGQPARTWKNRSSQRFEQREGRADAE